MVENMRQFKNLIKRYESITEDEIKDKWSSPNFNTSAFNVANEITGYGCDHTCKLCKAVNHHCEECIYNEHYGCCSGINEKTYDAINDARTPKQLLKAFRNRAKHLKKTYLK